MEDAWECMEDAWECTEDAWGCMEDAWRMHGEFMGRKGGESTKEEGPLDIIALYDYITIENNNKLIIILNFKV